MKRVLVTLLALCGATSAFAESESDCMTGAKFTSAQARIVCGDVTVSGAYVPDVDNSYDLGSGSFRFNEGFFGGDVVSSGDFSLLATGKTIEFETGTAASACAGNSTFNGTTAVTITTTCATTGSRIFLSATGDGSGSAANDQVGCWATNIVNGVSFDADCSDANNNATFNWIIFHEAP
jgi:hypothetical protein